MFDKFRGVGKRRGGKFGCGVSVWPRWKTDESPSSVFGIDDDEADDDEKAQRGYDWEIGYNKWLMRILGLWPLDDSCERLNFILILVLLTMYALPSVVGLAVIKSGSENQKNHGLGDRQVRNLTEAFPLMYGVAQFFVFKINNRKARIILQTIYENWKTSVGLKSIDKKPMYVFGGRTRFVMAMCMGFYFISFVVYFVEPLVTSFLSKEQNPTKKLANHGVYPFPTDISPNYEIMYAMQTLQGIVCTISIISIDGFLVLSAFHGCGQLALLCNTIGRYEGRIKHETSWEDDVAGTSMRDNCPCLRCIVERHVALARYVEMVDDVFHGIMMARMIMNTAHFCSVGYTIVKSNETSDFANLLINIIYMITMGINLFMYCWIGEQLLEEGEKIGETVYKLNWYNGKANDARSLILPILRTRRPMQLTAGKFFVMSFGCYKEWFMNSLGYLSVLLAIKSHT